MGNNCPIGFAHIKPETGGYDFTDLWQPIGCRAVDCIDCWRSRTNRARTSLLAQTEGWKGNSWLLTRSVRNNDVLFTSFDDLRRTVKSYKKRASKSEDHSWHTVGDWCGVVEVKNNHKGQGWNVHEHIVVNSSLSLLPYGKFQADWKAAAGDPAAHLDLQKLRPKQGVNYAVKYATKNGRVWGGLKPSDALAEEQALRGRRFLRRRRGSAPDLQSDFGMCCLPDSAGWCQKWVEGLEGSETCLSTTLFDFEPLGSEGVKASK